MAKPTDLPIELWIQIFDFLTRLEISFLSKCNHSLNWMLSALFFDTAFARRCRLLRPDLVYTLVFRHAVDQNSQRLVQWLLHHKLRSMLNGYVFRVFQASTLS